jgi:hypothetical protein
MIATPRFAGRRAGPGPTRASPFVFAVFAVFALSPWARADPAPNWEPVTQAELAETHSPSFPDAAAEVLFWKLELDDRNLTNERTVSEYVRYKVYDPARAVDVTRISALNTTVENLKLAEVTIHGRLTLPDGTSRELGQDSIHERPLQSRGAEETLAQRLVGNEGVTINEQFVTVEGLQPNSVLEFQIHSELKQSSSLIRNLQKVNIPVRHAECIVRLYQGEEFNGSAFVVNLSRLPLTQSYDKAHATLQVAADHLPPLVDEPFSPSVNSRSVTVFDYEQSTRFRNRHAINPTLATPSDGPWAPVAAKAALLEEDATTRPPDLVASTARKAAAGATSETEKARRIHNFVHDLYVRFTRSPAGSRELVSRFGSAPLDRVIAFDQYLDTPIFRDDFVWLELAMDRALDLDARAVLLPDRRIMPFDDRLHSGLFLSAPAAQVRVDGNWRFSLSNVPDLLPFGRLPWRFQNRVALVVQSGRQEFAPVPPEPAQSSVIENTGSFRLDPDGSLSGHGRRRLTGEPAILLRPRARNATLARFKQSMARRMKAEYPAAEVTVTAVTGLADPDAPLAFDYELTWPDYATATKTRLIFRPSVFHGESPSLFTATERKNALEFPYHWRELDDVSLQLPSGYALESPSAPPSAAVGNVLVYKVSIGPLARENEIFLRRDFTSELSEAPAGAYPAVKNWYDQVAQSDLHELVLAKAKSAPAGASP